MTLSEDKKFRILWHSVASYVRSGYGNTTRNITSRLVERGYEIIVSAYYGLEPGGTMKIAGVPHLPSKMGRFGEVSCKIHLEALRLMLCSSILTGGRFLGFLECLLSAYYIHLWIIQITQRN